MTGRLTCSLFYSQKCNINRGLQQLREVWTKNFKPSPVRLKNLGDVETCDRGGGRLRGVMSCGWESVWETGAPCQVNETREAQTRDSPSKRYVKPQVHQLEEWLKGKPIPYTSNDKFRQEGFFYSCHGHLPGHAHVNRTYPESDVVRMWKQFHGSKGINTKLPTGISQGF